MKLGGLWNLSFNASGISTIGSAGVATVGTLAVTGMALKAVGKATGNMNRSSSHKRSSDHRGKRSKGYSVWN